MGLEEATNRRSRFVCLDVLRGRVTGVTYTPLSFMSKKQNRRKKKRAKKQADKQNNTSV